MIVTDTEGKTFTASQSAVVTEDVPPEVVVAVTSAKMVACDKITVEFDSPEAKDKVTKDNLKISATNGTITIPVTNLEWAADGKTAVATLAISLSNDVEYAVAFGDSSTTFTAVIGEVASIGITTIEAEVNTDTKIEYTLFDAAGTDVTKNEDVSNRISIEVTGETSSYAVSDPKNPTIKMDTIGAEAQVVITYTFVDTTKAPVTAQQTIKCVPATETKGTGVFAVATGSNVNANSGSAKFYNGLSDASITIDENTTESNIYFYAADENGDAINYDLYEVTASDEDVLSATADVTEGKYAKISATGLKVGSSGIVVSAEKNSVKSTYIIPVTVRKAGKIKSISLTTTRTTMTNAIDSRYYGLITAKVLDTNGEDITSECDISFETSSTTKTGTDSLVEGLSALGADGFEISSADAVCEYTADGAKGGKYVVDVTASDSSGDSVKAQSTITVQALSADIWATEDNITASKSASISYDVELSTNAVDELDGDAALVQANMRALSGSKFVGYVNDDGSIGNKLVSTAGSKASVTLSGSLKFSAVENGTRWNNYKIAVKAGAEEEASAVDLTTYTITGNVDDGGALDGLKVVLSATNTTDSAATAEISESSGDYTLTVTPNKASNVDTLAKLGAVIKAAGIASTITSGTDEAVKTKANGIKEALASVELAVVEGQTYSYDTVLASAGKEFSAYVAPAEPGLTYEAATGSDLDTFAGTITYTYGILGDETNPLPASVEEAATQYEKFAAAETDGNKRRIFKAYEVDTTAGTVGAQATAAQFTGGKNDTASSPILASDSTKIDGNVYYAVKFGSLYSKTNDEILELYDHATNFSTNGKTDGATLTEGAEVILDPVSEEKTKIYVPSDTKVDNDFAKPGTYTIYFLYHDDKHKAAENKWGEATATVSVKNNITAPKVNVSSRKVASEDKDSFKDVLKINADLNNKDGAAQSLVSVLANDGSVAKEKDSKVVVKYAVVEENIFGVNNDVNFWVNLGNTFTVE